MARQLFCKAALAALAGLGIVGLARADGNCPTPQPVVINIITQQPGQAPMVSAPSGVVVNGDAATTTPRAHPVRAAIENRPHPLANAIDNHPPVGCWTTHNLFGCGSLRSDLTFMFGSCRTFYGQSCLKVPEDPLAPVREGGVEEPKAGRSWFPFLSCPSCRSGAPQ